MSSSLSHRNPPDKDIHTYKRSLQFNCIFIVTTDIRKNKIYKKIKNLAMYFILFWKQNIWSFQFCTAIAVRCIYNVTFFGEYWITILEHCDGTALWFFLVIHIHFIFIPRFANSNIFLNSRWEFKCNKVCNQKVQGKLLF